MRSALASGRLVVLGIGEEGWSGLDEAARLALVEARHIVGSARQLGRLPDTVSGERHPWESARRDDMAALAHRVAPDGAVVLASGDPMHFGIGSVLAADLGADALLVLPRPSAVSLACARLGWAVENVTAVSIGALGVDTLERHLAPRRRLVVLTSGRHTPAAVARLLVFAGQEAARCVVLGDLGSPSESRAESTAREWAAQPPLDVPRRYVVAIECADRPVPAPALGPFVVPTILRLLELPTATRLWDVGGDGEVGLAAADLNTVEVEILPVSRRRTPAVSGRARWYAGADPGVLPAPVDRVFLGGDTGAGSLVRLCWDALAPGGRIVAVARTVEHETALLRYAARFGGELVRMNLALAEPTEDGTVWAHERPVTIWAALRA